MNEKILITNNGALQRKYGGDFGKIGNALNKLVTADAARGITTKIIAVDSAQQMQAINGSPVTNFADARQNKDAVDAIYRKFVPDYLVLIGSVDIIPHQALRNPLYNPKKPDDDPDEFAFGDIPYASEAPYSRDPKDFIGPTRVLGRIPDITARSDPKYVVDLLDVAAKWNSRDAHDYLQYLGITADVWKKSTATSLQNTFGSDSDLQICPPKGPKWTTPLLSRLSHFINCHGAASSPVFYGQPKGQEKYPDAHLATWINGRIRAGTIVAAECCYGAELYDPQPVAHHQIGICSTYLANGAYGFFGSTTIAYGPEEGNGSADLISQFFLQRIIAGSSLGRAALEARQRFAQSATPLSPEGVKTLAQFILLGDPSIHPVLAPNPHETVELVRRTRKIASPAAMILEERAAERRRLFTRGLSITETQSVAATRRRKSAPPSLAQILKAIAGKEGLTTTSILSFDIEHPQVATKKALFSLAERISAPSAFHVAIGRICKEAPVTRIILIVAKEEGGKIVSVRKLHSR
jgi:hypothetical protein